MDDDAVSRSCGESILKVLNRAFSSLILHEITAHRIEQFKRERLAGKWRGYNHTSPKPLKPGTVNRELDALRGVLSKAVEWGQLLDSTARTVKRLKVDNRRPRILTEDEQMGLLAAAPPKLSRMLRLALMTGARFGELLALTWDSELTFLETKNGRSRQIPVSPAIKAVLDQCPKTRSGFVLTNPRTHEAAHGQRGCARLQAGAPAGGHRYFRREPPHAAAHGHQPHDRERHR